MAEIDARMDQGPKLRLDLLGDLPAGGTGRLNDGPATDLKLDVLMW
jgi:hypothetical protein